MLRDLLDSVVPERRARGEYEAHIFWSDFARNYLRACVCSVAEDLGAASDYQRAARGARLPCRSNRGLTRQA